MTDFAFDTETYPIGDGNLCPRMVCLSYADSQGKSSVLGRRAGCEAFLEALEVCNLIGANTAFDLAVMARAVREELGLDIMPQIFRAFEEERVHDIIIREGLIHLASVGYVPNFGQRSLAALTRKYLGEKRTGKSGIDSWRVRYNELDGVPVVDWPRSAYDYALEDAQGTLAIYRKQGRIKSPVSGFGYDYTVTNELEQVAADFCLHLCSCWGIEVSPERSEPLFKDWRRQLEDLEAQLKSHGVLRPNGTKDRAMIQTLVTAAYNGNPPRTDPTAKFPRGQVATTREVVDEAPNPDTRLDLLIRYNGFEKNLSTYAKPIEEAIAGCGSIHPRYNVLLNTGRTSASNPNIQNQNQNSGIRECYRPRTGCVFVSADLDGQEHRSWTQVAYLLGMSPDALQLYRENPGHDPHSWLGKDILARTRGRVLTYEEFLGLKGSDGEVKEARKLAKPFVFGAPAGMVPATFVPYAKGYGLNLSLEQSEELHAIWLDADSAHVRWLDWGRRMTRHRRADFEHPFSGRVRAACTFTRLLNTPFQGIAADGAKAALFNIQKGCYTKTREYPALYGARLVFFVHDEWGIEVHESRCQDAARDLERAILDGVHIYHPDVPCRASADIMRVWSKAAASTKLPNGDLTIWSPS